MQNNAGQMSAKVHPAFGQRRWRAAKAGTFVGKEKTEFDVGKCTPVWFGYTVSERDARL
jgi:hypothetical protein